MFIRGLIKPLVAGAALIAWTAMLPAIAQTPTPPQHIRGSIESVGDHTIAVKTARGATDTINFPADKTHC